MATDDELSALLARMGDPLTLLEGIFRYAPVGIQIYSPAGRSVLTNPAFREMFGSEPPPEYNVLNDEIAERTGVLGLIRRAFTGETVTTPPIWYDPRELSQVRVSEGRRVAMTATFFPLRDAAGAVAYVAVVFRDVTAETLAREQAEAERDLLNTVIEQSGDGIVVADERGRLRVFNRVAAEQYGAPLLPVPPEQWAEAYGLRSADGAQLPKEQLPLYRALHGESVFGARIRVRRPDGGERVMVGTAAPLRKPDGSAAGAVLISRDETDRLRAEEELRRDAELRERFIGILGHDLRTPLSSITITASMLARQASVPESLRGPLARIVTAAARMERMIRDLLDLTRARHGGIPIDVGPCDLAAVARQVVAEVESAHPGRRIELGCEGDARGRWDADRVAQTVANLLVNAVAYSPRDSAVRVSVRGADERVDLQVQNEGAPISPAALERLFDPFRRARSDPRTASTSGGLGLGLYIVDQVVRAHGGSVQVTSTAEEGTVVTVSLPRGAPA